MLRRDGRRGRLRRRRAERARDVPRRALFRPRSRIAPSGARRPARTCRPSAWRPASPKTLRGTRRRGRSPLRRRALRRRAAIPSPACEERCEDHAADEFRRCLAEGGDEETARPRRARHSTGCVQLHCEEAATAAGTLRRRSSDRLERRCLGSRTRCGRGVPRRPCGIDTRCELKHCPPPPDTCGAECEARAHALGEECAARDDGTDCEALVHGRSRSASPGAARRPTPTCTESVRDAAPLSRLTAGWNSTGNAQRATRRALRAFRHCAGELRASEQAVDPGALKARAALSCRKLAAHLGRSPSLSTSASTRSHCSSG